MTEMRNLNELLSQINNHIQVAERLFMFYQKFRYDEMKDMQTISNAIVLSGIITKYYTCLETMFLRISRFFEIIYQIKNCTRTFLKK